LLCFHLRGFWTNEAWTWTTEREESRARRSRRRHVVLVCEEQAEGWTGDGQEHKGFAGETAQPGWTDSKGEDSSCTGRREDFGNRGITSEQLEEDLAKNISTVKVTLQGTPEAEANAEQVYALVAAILADGLLPILVDNIHRLPFEARKDTQTIISNVFRFRSPNSTSTEPDALRDVIRRQPELIVALCNGYDRRESASPCGGILKEALKWDAVAAVILYDEPLPNGKTVDIYTDVDTSKPSTGQGVFWKFFDWIDKSSFEVSADAFDTFRLLLTKHKPLVAQYIGTNFDMFFERYNNVLIRSESYVTKRQSIKLLGEVLLDRQFYEVMTRYVDSGDNLKLIMWQLKDDRRMVQYEGFHVFKVRQMIFLRCSTVLTKHLTDLRRKPQQILRSPEIPHHEQTAPAQVPAKFPRRPNRRRPIQ
jgi:calcium binding protein 39